MILDRRLGTTGVLSLDAEQVAGASPAQAGGQCGARPSAWQTVADCLEESDSLPQTWLVMRELGDRHAGLSDIEAAQECYLLAHCLAPKEPEPLVRFGVLAMQSERLSDAEKAFEKAQRLDPRYGEAYNGLAMVLQMRKEYGKALEMYLKCLELNPDNLTALLGLFQSSCEMGTFSKIIHYLEVYLSRHPNDREVLACVAALYGREGRKSKAREVLRKIGELEANDVEVAELVQSREPG